MDAILQTIFGSAFSWMKMFEFRIRFHRSLFLRVQLKNNNPALVQVMAWHRAGDKPLSEPMMVSLPTHICVTRTQWVNRNVHMCAHFCNKMVHWGIWDCYFWGFAQKLKYNFCHVQLVGWIWTGCTELYFNYRAIRSFNIYVDGYIYMWRWRNSPLPLYCIWNCPHLGIPF